MNLGKARFAGETVRRSYNLRSRITVSNSNTTRPGHGPPRNPGSPPARDTGPEQQKNKKQGDPISNGRASASAFSRVKKRLPVEERASSNRSTNISKPCRSCTTEVATVHSNLPNWCQQITSNRCGHVVRDHHLFFSCVCLLASMARSVNCLGQKNREKLYRSQVHLIGAEPFVQVRT